MALCMQTKLSSIAIAVAALFFAFVATVQVPVEIYINNVDEFSLPLQQLTYTFSTAFVLVFAALFLPALIPNLAFRERYFAFLATLAWLVWFTAHFLFGDYGTFDGRGLSVDIFSAKAIIEATIWIIALVAAIIYAKKIQSLLLQATGGLFIIVLATTGYQIGQYALHEEKHFDMALHEEKHYMPTEFLTFSTQRNVIHFVLDEQQSTVIESLIETNPEFKQNLTGFTFFPNTTANYRSTVMAIPAMLTSKVYRNTGDKNLFLQEVLSHNPFITTLENDHYRTHVYTMGFYCNKAEIKNCIPQPERAPNLSAILLLDYSLFKMVPDMLKPVIYRNERWIIQKHFINPNYETTLAGLNHLAFTYFNDNLVVEDIAPTYKFYHSMITHSPTVLRGNCDLYFSRVSRQLLSGKADQATCAFHHLFTFIAKLKQAGIYDQTMIIISSDHGSNYLSPDQQESVKHSAIPKRHYSTALATLLIKPFNAQEPLQISYAPAALHDIPNTILSSLKLPLLPAGKNILTLDPQQPRRREFIFYDMNKTYWETSQLPPLTIYTIQGDVRDIRDWQLECSDVVNEANKCTIEE